jgi:hypothetical protein
MLNEDTTDRERKGGNRRERREKKGEGEGEGGLNRAVSEGLWEGGKKSPLLKKKKQNVFTLAANALDFQKVKGGRNGVGVGPRTVSMVTTQMAIPHILTALCV